MRHQHVRARACHGLRRRHVEDVRSCDQTFVGGHVDHLDLEVIAHAGLLEVRAESPVIQPDGREVLDPGEARRLNVAQEVAHEPERIGAAHASQHRRVVNHRQDLSGHLHDDRVGVAVRQEAGERAASGHPVAPGVVNDDQVRSTRLRAFGGKSGARAGADEHPSRVDHGAQPAPGLFACHLRTFISSSSRAAIPCAAESLRAIWRPSSALSLGVVSMSVTEGLWTYRLRDSNCGGTVSRAPKLTMSNAPTDTTCGTPSLPAISRRSGPAESTPPTSSSASSVVVMSSTPVTKPDSTSASIARPPVPVAGNVSTPYPRRSSSSRAAVTDGVVTPNIVAAIRGRCSPSSIGGELTMPAIAAAALARMRPEIELIPATSVTDAIRAMSLAPM